MTGWHGRPISRFELAPVGAAAATLFLLAGRNRLSIGFSLVAIGMPPIAWIALARGEREGRRCDPRLVAALTGILLVCAVILPPHGSRDVWSYAMYGRMVSEHWASPYTHVPNDFPHDPYLRQVGIGWRNTPSVYGPVFVALTTAGSWIAGSSFLAARLFHQSLAAIAVAVSLVLIWRRTNSAAALALLGLNPVIVISVVNGGHNDALVGLGILVATMLATSRRLGLAGSALGVAALIKVTALLAFPALLAWVVWRLGRRAAIRFVVTLGSVTVLGYAAAGPEALTALSGNRRLMSRASPWQIPRVLLGIGTPHPALGISGHAWIGLLATGSLLGVAGIVLAATWWRRRDSEPEPSVVLALTAYFVVGIYVLPWYAAWMLPVACITLDQRSRRLAVLMSTFLFAVYTVKTRALPHSVQTEWHWLGSYLGPIVLLLVVCATVVPLHSLTMRPGREPSRSAE